MTVQRECELKFHIEERPDFLDLRDSERWGTRSVPERQVNHYFDTEDLLLAKQRILLRIREAEGCVLTLKCGREVSPGNFDSLEIESEVSPGLLAAAREHPPMLLDLDLPGIDELKRRVGHVALRTAGTLENERVRREIGGWTLEVDRLSFPDGTETYELEIETVDVDGARAWIDRELRSRGMRLEPQRRTKFERLLDWYATRDAGP